MRNPRKVEALHRARELAVAIHRIVPHYPEHEAHDVAEQLRRVARAVPTAIFHACVGNEDKEFLHFVNVALRSLAEVDFLVEFLNELGFLGDDYASNIHDHQDACSEALLSLTQSLSD